MSSSDGCIYYNINLRLRLSLYLTRYEQDSHAFNMDVSICLQYLSHTLTWCQDCALGMSGLPNKVWS